MKQITYYFKNTRYYAITLDLEDDADGNDFIHKAYEVVSTDGEDTLYDGNGYQLNFWEEERNA